MRGVAACCKKINQIDFGGTQYKVEVWSDDDMIPGERWNPQIEDNIKDADVVLFLLSPNFIQSKFIVSKEIPLAVKRWQESKIGLLGIYVAKCNFDHLPISKIQMVPSSAGRLKPSLEWNIKTEYWAAVKDGIEMCAYNSISRLPWNQALAKKFPAKLQEKKFVQNAPPELQGLLEMVREDEAVAEFRQAKKRMEQTEANNTAIIQIAVIVLILLIAYKIITKFL